MQSGIVDCFADDHQQLPGDAAWDKECLAFYCWAHLHAEFFGGLIGDCLDRGREVYRLSIVMT